MFTVTLLALLLKFSFSGKFRDVTLRCFTIASFYLLEAAAGVEVKLQTFIWEVFV